MSKWSTRQIATAAIIAALYTVMSMLSSIFGLTYGPIQCRFSEALTVLPFFLPEAVPGLFVGCLVTNLMSTVGPLDIIFGSMATLLAALWTAKMPNKFLATLPPVICNAVIIGAMIAWYEGGFSAQFPALFAYNALTVGIGEPSPAVYWDCFCWRSCPGSLPCGDGWQSGKACIQKESALT